MTRRYGKAWTCQCGAQVPEGNECPDCSRRRPQRGEVQKVKLIKDCSWRGGKEPCPNLATIYPLTFDPNAEGLCGEHWSMRSESTVPTDDAAAKKAMAEIRRILAKSPLMQPVPAVVVDENAGW